MHSGRRRLASYGNVQTEGVLTGGPSRQRISCMGARYCDSLNSITSSCTVQQSFIEPMINGVAMLVSTLDRIGLDFSGDSQLSTFASQVTGINIQ